MEHVGLSISVPIRCKAIFVDTDQVPAFDSRVGDLVQNEVEGKLVYQIAEALLQCGVSQRQIGIMSRRQEPRPGQGLYYYIDGEVE